MLDMLTTEGVFSWKSFMVVSSSDVRSPVGGRERWEVEGEERGLSTVGGGGAWDAAAADAWDG